MWPNRPSWSLGVGLWPEARFRRGGEFHNVENRREIDMQLPWDIHFLEIVIPAWQAYLSAENRLSEALHGSDDQQLDRARFDSLREAGAATFYAHHFAEIVLRARPFWLPRNITKAKEIRHWLNARCTMLRTEEPISDVYLLGDVANALKHAILTQFPGRDVHENDEVLVVASGYGQLRFGEGKFGGVEQVLVLAKSGTRVLSSVLQNVIDAWRFAAGIELPAIGVP